jgi:hypothetical protein
VVYGPTYINDTIKLCSDMIVRWMTLNWQQNMYGTEALGGCCTNRINPQLPEGRSDTTVAIKLLFNGRQNISE